MTRTAVLIAVLGIVSGCAAPLEDPGSFVDAGAGGSGGGGVGGQSSGGASGVPDPGKGKTVYLANTCSACHKSDLSGGGIPGAANLTPDPDHGLGTWTDAEIRSVLLTGIKKDGSKVCASMAQYTSLSDGDLADLIAFLRSVPASPNAPAACK